MLIDMLDIISGYMYLLCFRAKIEYNWNFPFPILVVNENFIVAENGIVLCARWWLLSGMVDGGWRKSGLKGVSEYFGKLVS